MRRDQDVSGFSFETSGKSKGAFREYAEAIVVAVLIALFLRSFVVEPFKIPSGSMIPTLLVGDHIFVNKFIYGLRIPLTDIRFLQFAKPRRGDVIVFLTPEDDQEPIYKRRDFIKRVVAVEGDTIELKDNALYVNGKAVETATVGNFGYLEHDICRRVTAEELTETVPRTSYKIIHHGFSPYRNFGPETVKAEHVFCMGDNRDNSSDSRVWGQVPLSHIKGKAMIIWLSLEDCEFGIRFDRFGERII